MVVVVVLHAFLVYDGVVVVVATTTTTLVVVVVVSERHLLLYANVIFSSMPPCRALFVCSAHDTRFAVRALRCTAAAGLAGWLWLAG